MSSTTSALQQEQTKRPTTTSTQPGSKSRQAEGKPRQNQPPNQSQKANRAHRIKRSTVHLWVPNQHGAWMMALCPPVAGLIAGGFSWLGFWLCWIWLACYFTSYALGRWLVSRKAKRFRTPAITYAAIAAVLGIPLVVLRPWLCWWIPAYLLVLVAHLWAAHSRNQRSLWANAAAVVGSGLTAWITVILGPLGVDSLGERVWFPAVGLAVAIAYVLQEFGSVLFVKTMFRERNSKPYYVASVAWHLLVSVVGFWINWVFGVTAILLLLRAAMLPFFATKLKPLPIGMFEVASTIIAFGGITWGAALLA